jgi:uncharacterized iron-regulated membrane protein
MDELYSRRRRRQSTTLKLFRKIHKTIGACLFAFFFVLACTGLLLGLKKHSNGWLLARSHQGTSTDMSSWLPIAVLHERATAIARDASTPGLAPEFERIDIRPDKGMVKFLSSDGYWGIQLDCATGGLLHLERRRSDFLEDIHDGSILDDLLGTGDEQIKLAYTSVMGVSLLTFTITGFWLWLGPKRMRATSLKHRDASHELPTYDSAN